MFHFTTEVLLMTPPSQAPPTPNLAHHLPQVTKVLTAWGNDPFTMFKSEHRSCVHCIFCVWILSFWCEIYNPSTTTTMTTPRYKTKTTRTKTLEDSHIWQNEFPFYLSTVAQSCHIHTCSIYVHTQACTEDEEKEWERERVDRWI